MDYDVVRVTRRAWASRPDGAIHLELRAESAEIEVELDLTTRLRECGRSVDADGIGLRIEIPVDGALARTGRGSDAVAWRPGPPRPSADAADGDWIPAAAVRVAVHTDGEVAVDGDRLVIRGARTVRLTVASSTAAEDWFAGAPETIDAGAHERRASDRAFAALAGDADAALQRHLDDGCPPRCRPRRCAWTVLPKRSW